VRRRSTTSLRRVLVFAGDLRLGGAEKQLVALCGALQNAGIDVRVCVYQRGHHYDAALAATGAQIVDGPIRTDPASRTLHASRLARTTRPDLVLSWRFYLNIYAALAARAIGVPGIGAMREDIHDAFAGVGRLGPVCLRLPTAILTNSHRAADAVRARGMQSRYLGNVIDLATFDANAQQPVDPPHQPLPGPHILAVGTLKAEKAYDILLKAVRILLDRGTAATLSIAGEGELLASLQEQANQLGVSQQVRFLGSRNDIPALMRTADISVLSSRQEGTPNAVLEAMAGARAIVTTDVGDAARLVEHGRSGLVVPPEDPTALAEALQALLSDPTTAARYGAAARETVAAYDAAGLGTRAIAVLEPFCDSHKTRPLLPTRARDSLLGGRRVRDSRNS
jgi:glycosyltransferase involved in cell wall biosynthesis